MASQFKRRIAAAAVAVTAATVAGVAGAQPAQAACDHYVAQYVLTGQDGTIRDAGGSTIGYWYRGYVINTWGYGGRQPGTTYGNIYTADRQFVTSGDVVSAYMQYSRSFCT
ncbi:hypothetical protein [Actinoplanes sp. TFC3]|uniref:hypothetical protein n=1 Tax=Actinoplanes sp. TFC3 TaxID=1710355 RepID=UPI00082B0CFB|nr:hypothetical protein [Actinoplanes sp. TFC3]